MIGFPDGGARRLVMRASLLLAAALLAGCRDDSPAGDGSAGRNDAAMTEPADGLAAASRTRERLHASNRLEWVGIAHNEYMKVFSRELRKPGVLTRNMCSYLMEFAERSAPAEPRLRALPGADFAAAGRSGLLTVSLCDASALSTVAVPVALLSRAPQEEEVYVLSPAASDLATQVVNAVDAAQTSADLANALASVLVTAERLDTLEQAIISSSISVAQNSFEYWEAEYSAMVDAFYVDYGACLEQAWSSGYSMDSGREACMKGGLAITRAPGPPARPFAMAGLRGSRTIRLECGLAANFKKVAGADVVGAITGAVKGAKGGSSGAASGAAAGAALASLGQYVKSTWDLFWCAME